MIGKIKCLFGFHDWVLNNVEVKLGTIRECRRCYRRETASYDMAYGETIWLEVKQEATHRKH